MKYYRDEENYLWRMENEVWEILDPNLGWDEWKEGDEVEPIENFVFYEVPEEEALKEIKVL